MTFTNEQYLAAIKDAGNKDLAFANETNHKLLAANIISLDLFLEAAKELGKIILAR